MYNDNLARKYEPRKRGKEIPVTTPRQLRQHKRKLRVNLTNALKLGVLLAIFVVGSLFVLSRNVKVTEQSERVQKLKEEYSLIETENRKKEIEISRKVDIATVEEKAIAVSNMNRARQDQIMYINVQAEDYGVVASKERNEESGGVMWGLLAYLK